MLSKEQIQAQREAVVKEAITWIGTPFHHAAGIKGVGVDCAGISLSYKAVLGDLFIEPDFAHEFPIWQWHLNSTDEFYVKRLYAHGFVEIDRNDALPGDVVMSKIARVFCHAGIIENWPYVIQSESIPSGAGKVIRANAESNWFLTARELKFMSLAIWR